MTFEDIATMLESTGLPVAYNAFRVGNVPELPYIVYSFPNSDNFGADNKTYKNIESLRVWLCTKQKDFFAEYNFESVLNANDLFWNKTESFEQNDAMYMILYEMEILINAEQS